jgi:hypothetical protein
MGLEMCGVIVMGLESDCVCDGTGIVLRDFDRSGIRLCDCEWTGFVLCYFDET